MKRRRSKVRWMGLNKRKICLSVKCWKKERQWNAQAQNQRETSTNVLKKQIITHKHFHTYRDWDTHTHTCKSRLQCCQSRSATSIKRKILGNAENQTRGRWVQSKKAIRCTIRPSCRTFLSIIMVMWREFEWKLSRDFFGRGWFEKNCCKMIFFVLKKI